MIERRDPLLAFKEERTRLKHVSCEYKNVILEDEENHDRTGRPVVCPQGGAHQFVIEDDETESDLSLGSRSFLHKVNDRVRKMLDQSSKDATQDSDKHSLIWRMFMSSTLEASIFHGEGIARQFTFQSKNTGNNLTMKTDV